MSHKAQREDAYHVTTTSHRVGRVPQPDHNFVGNLSVHLIECAVLLEICHSDRSNPQRDHSQSQAIQSRSGFRELDCNNDQQHGSNGCHANAANRPVEVWRAWLDLSQIHGNLPSAVHLTREFYPMPDESPTSNRSRYNCPATEVAHPTPNNE